MPDESVEIKHLSDLIPLGRNARRRTPRSAGMIVESIHEVGAARSGVIDENYTILAGNGTAEALAEAGIEKVKVVQADGNEWVVVQRTGLSDEQKRKLAQEQAGIEILKDVFVSRFGSTRAAAWGFVGRFLFPANNAMAVLFFVITHNSMARFAQNQHVVLIISQFWIGFPRFDVVYL